MNLKMGIVDVEGRATTAFVSDLSLRRKLSDRAKRDGLSMSEVIRKLLTEALARGW